MVTISTRIRQLDEQITRARALRSVCQDTYLRDLARVRAAWAELEKARAAVDELEVEADKLMREAVGAGPPELPARTVVQERRGSLPSVLRANGDRRERDA